MIVSDRDFKILPFFRMPDRAPQRRPSTSKAAFFNAGGRKARGQGRVG